MLASRGRPDISGRHPASLAMPQMTSPAQESVIKFVAHSQFVLRIALRYGWMPAARYTNLRDVRKFERIGFLDVDWKDYSYRRHLEAAKSTRAYMTVARDIDDHMDLARTLDQALELKMYCEHVVIVPKDPSLADKLDALIPRDFILGYSVPTRYGATSLPPDVFKRPVHLLGGRPDVQRHLATLMPVVSVDCNRFTLDAAYGDFFDGVSFRPHPSGGYERCIRESIKNINTLWKGYIAPGRWP